MVGGAESGPRGGRAGAGGWSRGLGRRRARAGRWSRASRGLDRWSRGADRWSSGIGLLLFCVGSVLLFFPILGRTFASDDFEVMQRVGRGDFRTPGFFRPLSDLTLYFNYLLGGFHPAGYYLFNIIVHGVNSWLIVLFCLRWRWTEDEGRQRSYALLAGLLFLAYPFHNEGIVWLLGRGASLAVFFGLAALLMAVSDGGRRRGRGGWVEGGWVEGGRRRLGWAAIFYFAGLMAYETELLLPLMCLVILYVRGADRKEMIRWGGVLGGVLILHLVLRVVVSGGLLGEYERDFFGPGWWRGPGLWRYAGNAGRVAIRLLLPPSDNHRALLSAFAIVLSMLPIVLSIFYRRVRQREQRLYLRGLFWLGCLACLIPVLSAVSTRTSESDRLLYFPSVFLCCLLSYLLVKLVGNRRVLIGISLLLLGYMVACLEKNNRNWIRASDITRDILNVTLDLPKGGKIFIINLPDEKDGAFIFRLGFPQALLMAGGDTAGMVVVGHLSRADGLAMPDSIGIQQLSGREIAIAPGTVIGRLGVDSFWIRVGVAGRYVAGEENRDKDGAGGGDSAVGGRWLAGKGDRVLYWNKKRLEPVLFR